MDLVAGHYIVSRGTPSPFQLNGFESLAVSISLLPVFGHYALLLRGMYFLDLYWGINKQFLCHAAVSSRGYSCDHCRGILDLPLLPTR
jgi:hypothetical protein